MDDYNFFADLLDTFQSSSDYIKTVIILVPPAFVLGVVHLLTRHRRHTTEGENADFVALTPLDGYTEKTEPQPRLTHEQTER